MRARQVSYETLLLAMCARECVSVCLCVWPSIPEILKWPEDKERPRWRETVVGQQWGKERDSTAEGWGEVEQAVCRPVCHCCWGGEGRGERKGEERAKQREHTHTHSLEAATHYQRAPVRPSSYVSLSWQHLGHNVYWHSLNCLKNLQVVKTLVPKSSHWNKNILKCIIADSCFTNTVFPPPPKKRREFWR